MNILPNSRLSLLSITLLSLAVNACSGPATPGDSMSASDTDTDSDSEGGSESDSGGGSGGSTGGESDAGSDGESDSAASDSDSDSGADSDGEDPIDEPQLPTRCSNVGLSEENAAQLDELGEEMVWTTALDEAADTLTLSRAGSCGEDCSFYDEVVFINVSASTDPVCDELMIQHATREIEQAGTEPELIELDENGHAFVQDWKPGEMVSGQIVIDPEGAAIVMTFYTHMNG